MVFIDFIAVVTPRIASAIACELFNVCIRSDTPCNCDLSA